MPTLRSADTARLTAATTRDGVRVQLCEQCGAAIVTLKGVTVGVGNATLAQLARFGLAVTGEPLLELRRGGL